MPESYDPNELLGLRAGASATDIEKAYKRKAKTVHPDVSDAPDANEQFIRLTAARDLLIERLSNPSVPTPQSLYRPAKTVSEAEQDRIIRVNRRKREADARRRSRRRTGTSRATRDAMREQEQFQEEMQRRRQEREQAEQARKEREAVIAAAERERARREAAEREAAQREQERVERERRREQEEREAREREARERRQREARERQEREEREERERVEREQRQREVRARREQEEREARERIERERQQREQRERRDWTQQRDTSGRQELATCAWKGCHASERLSAPVTTVIGLRRFCDAHFESWVETERARRTSRRRGSFERSR